MKTQLPATLFFILLFSFFCTNKINAQEFFAPDVNANAKIKWSSCWQNNSSTYVNDMAVDKAGNTYTTGYFYDAKGYQRYYIRKTDKNGNEKWVKYYFNSYPDTSERGTVVRVDENGYVFTAGMRYNTLNSGCTTWVAVSNPFVIAYNTNGNMLWNNQYPSGTTIATALDMLIGSGSNCYVLFQFSNCGDGSIIRKLDKNGQVLWDYNPLYYANGYGNYFTSGTMTFDNNNNITAAFYKYPFPILKTEKSTRSLYTVKVSMKTGKEVWHRDYADIFPYIDAYPHSVACSDNGDVYVYAVELNNAPAFIKYTTNGKYRWTVNEANASYNQSYNKNLLAIDSDNKIIFAYQNGVSKFDSSGSLLWKKPFPPDLYTASVKTDSVNNVYVTGTVYTNYIASTNTVKLNKKGRVIWSSSNNNHNLSSVASGLGLDANANVYVSANSNFQACVLKIANQTTESIQQSINAGSVSQISLKNQSVIVFPNPAKDYVTIKFSNPQTAIASVILRDMTGRVVIHKNISHNQLYLGSMPEGIYFLQVIDDSKSETIKLIIKR